MFLHLCHVEPPEFGRRGALCEQTDRGPLPEPLGQPAQVTVAVQIVGVETAVKGERKTGNSKNRDARTCPVEETGLRVCCFIKLVHVEGL